MAIADRKIEPATPPTITRRTATESLGRCGAVVSGSRGSLTNSHRNELWLGTVSYPSTIGRVRQPKRRFTRASPIARGHVSRSPFSALARRRRGSELIDDEE